MFNEVSKKFKSINLDEMRFPGFLEKRANEIKQCVDNVVNGKGLKEIHECPICNCKERKVLFRRFGINIVQCRECDVGYAEKFPMDMADVYSNEDYLSIAKSDYLDNVNYRKQRFAGERLEIIRNHLDIPPEKTRLLDVGCGTGWFLGTAKEVGYQVFGQELGRDLAAFTSECLGIKVWKEPFPEIPQEEKFDVITLFDVMEHVSNPREVVKAIEGHLNLRGIALIFTPNLDSFCFWRLKERSSQVMPVEHLFYYTKKSFVNLLNETKLKLLNFETKGMDIPDIYSYYRDETDQQQVAEFLKENCSGLQSMIDQSGCANHMRFIVKKEV